MVDWQDGRRSTATTMSICEAVVDGRQFGRRQWLRVDHDLVYEHFGIPPQLPALLVHRRPPVVGRDVVGDTGPATDVLHPDSVCGCDGGVLEAPHVPRRWRLCGRYDVVRRRVPGVVRRPHVCGHDAVRPVPTQRHVARNCNRKEKSM